MIIAVPYKNGNIFQHFGKTEALKLYETSDAKINKTEIIPTNSIGHGGIVDILRERKVSVLICSGIGNGAKKLLRENSILFFGGASGDADKAVSDYLMGQLVYDADAGCNHHCAEEG
ncbi:NifB/NifX family molybdenum-iron cluster-binding protein [Pectinatus cerevisiiphilus]|uniref:Putative Fe-Mo cluster-binding NifX family protein n=1 Tax=Pectinatus cerevisiiphilus TaxID=86956 RepID=A0A4V2URE0_9FIRM|nr:NifB/NifX family molybdenum-iron cluster-binding protein [Pectinatus cerevisiiphilus]TCS76784.1 putative Fe-Mo cluster-binding NifX family protein [Pectinatus cerevisiiphilus]